MCQVFYHILQSSKTRFTQGQLFYTQRPLLRALGPLFCALVREEAIFVVCKQCAKEGFACMCKEKLFSWHAYGMYDFRPMYGGRKVTRSRTGHGKYCCACAHPTEKYKFRLCMRTLNVQIELPVAHAHFEKNLNSAPVRGRFKSYIPCTVTKSIVCNTCGGASRLQLVSATPSIHLDSIVGRAANFTHSSGITLMPHLIYNILFSES